MCDQILNAEEISATGRFSKGNEPEPLEMKVDAVQCPCGRWYVRVPGGVVWVEAEKIS